MAHTPRPVFIGSAWPYANGSLHIGHIAALLPADCLARFFRLQGHEVAFVSGSDCHGTPISVRAEKEKEKPFAIAQKYHEEFADNFKRLGFSYSLYGNTMDSGHAAFVQDVFTTLHKKNLIYTKEVVAMYCEKDDRFLPDRYIEGECPTCGFAQARGDQCDSCGSLLEPETLKNPTCKLCGETPVAKQTEHFYFALSKFQKHIEAYAKTFNDPRGSVKRFVEQYLKQGLHDRPITRDLDWGIKVPIPGYESKRIYVWFEAVCGYISATQRWSKENGIDWKLFWKNPEVSAWYVYGKDNIPFHTILWPAICLAYDEQLHLPDWHVSSEYLQLEGKKISTSRNWAIWVPDMLTACSQTQIRFGLIVLAPETSDTNFTLKEFKDKFNNEFIATLGNYIQRILTLAGKAHITTIAPIDPSLAEANEMQTVFKEVGQLFQKGSLRAATIEVLRIASLGNKQLDADAPWKHLKEHVDETTEVIKKHCRLAAQFSILLEPLVPEAAEKIRSVLGVPKPTGWEPYLDTCSVQTLTEPLFSKIEDSQLAPLRTSLTETLI